MTGGPELTTATPPDVVWHVGRRPEPWAWVPKRYAGQQRWDDLFGTFRTVYAGSLRFGCYVEVLAHFRKDPQTAAGMGKIIVSEEDAALYPTFPSGEIDQTWVDARSVSSARMTGVFCDVTTAAAIAPAPQPKGRASGSRRNPSNSGTKDCSSPARYLLLRRRGRWLRQSGPSGTEAACPFRSALGLDARVGIRAPNEGTHSD